MSCPSVACHGSPCSRPAGTFRRAAMCAASIAPQLGSPVPIGDTRCHVCRAHGSGPRSRSSCVPCTAVARARPLPGRSGPRSCVSRTPQADVRGTRASGARRLWRRRSVAAAGRAGDPLSGDRRRVRRPHDRAMDPEPDVPLDARLTAVRTRPTIPPRASRTRGAMDPRQGAENPDLPFDTGSGVPHH